MSFKVNDIEVPIYTEDNRSRILNRIATFLNTLPKYIDHLPENIVKNEEYKVDDFLEKIKNDSGSTDFREFLNNNLATIQRLGLNIKNDVLLPWLAYNEAIENIAIYIQSIFDSVGGDLVQDEYFIDQDDFKRTWKDRKSILTKINNEIEKNKTEENFLKEVSQTIEKVDGVFHSDFIIERISIKSFLHLENVTLLELFNLILTNENVPFATCQNYFKIHKDFIPPSRDEDEKYDWDLSLQDTIILKVFSTTVSELKKYSNVYISVENENVYLKTRLDVQKIYASQDMMMKRIISAFNTAEPISYSEPIQEKVIGTFYYPQFYINTYILSDLIMNNSIFSAYLNTLEFNKVSKKIDLTGQTWLSMWFSEDNKIVSASLSRKTIDRKDFYLRSTDPKIFPHGEPSIRVHASGKNIIIINRFMEILSKLLTIYKNEEEKIKIFYKTILPDFGEYGIEKVGELKKAEVDRNVFVINYSRSCPKMPTEITRDEAERLIENKERDVLLFPRSYPGIGPRYNSDDINQKYYICDHKEYPYPGVKENKKLSNKEDYPYIPCCYENPQSDFEKFKSRKRFEKYDLYYKGSKASEKEELKQPKFITTNKILKSDKTGTLPNKLLKIFDGINDKEHMKFIRMGVDRNKSSFLNCILTALQKLNITSESKRREKLKSLREELSYKNFAVLCKQSLFEPTLTQVSDKIKNFDEYFDPKLFCQMIEQLFNCNIYIFNNEKMLLPNSIEGLYRTKKNGNTILIYEHMGSEFDAATYPQCELIVRWDQRTEKKIEYNFKPDSVISKKIDMMYMFYNASYLNGQLIDNIEAKLPIKLISSQILDAFGKCRCINISTDTLKFSVFLSPIEPLKVIPLEKQGIKYIKKENLLEIKNILENNGFIFTSSNEGYIGNVKFYLKLLIKNLETLEESKIKIFNRNKKFARYITQYTFWCFSKFLNNREITKEILQDFMNTGFVIIPDHNYDNLPKKFELNNSMADANGKVIVINNEMIKRLMYSLRLSIIQSEDEIKNYKNSLSMKGYYEDITDFNVYTNQILLAGEDSVDKWINNNKGHIINSGIILDTYEPYFFMNKKISNKVFIAQNTDSLGIALDIANNWNIYNYNIGNYGTIYKEKIEFNLYSYSSPNNIEYYKVKGEKTDKPINIIGYKNNGKSKFTVLLDNQSN